MSHECMLLFGKGLTSLRGGFCRAESCGRAVGPCGSSFVCGGQAVCASKQAHGGVHGAHAPACGARWDTKAGAEVRGSACSMLLGFTC